MSKKKTSIVQPNQSSAKVAVATIDGDLLSAENNATNWGAGASKWTKWIAGLVVALLALAVFFNSRGNQYVLDDHGIIKSNKITKGGLEMENIKKIFTTSHRAGDLSDLEHSLYRPVAKLIFAAEYQWGGGKPEYFHAWNIFYMMLCCFMLYWLLYLATKQNWVIALAIAGLFAVHPIHSESVANIKSLDEVLGAIGVIGALICFHYYSINNKFYLLPIALFSYCVGIFSKESTIVAVALAPLYMYYFTGASRKQIIFATVVMVIGAGLFLFARQEAIGWFLSKPQKDPSALDNVLAMTKLDQTKVGGYQMAYFIPTVIYLMGYYVYTLFVPYPLSCDYSYASVKVVGLTNTGLPGVNMGPAWYFWVSFIMFAALIYFAIKTFKQKNIIGFGILWFLIASSIISNLFIVIGTSFGERLMFLPSIGWCIAVVGALYHFLKYAQKHVPQQMNFVTGIKKHAIMFIILGIVGTVYGAKTMSRNADWFKDYTLFSRDVKLFDESTHLLFYWGNHLSSSEYHEILKSQGFGDKEIAAANRESIQTFKNSMVIYPALPSDGYNQYGKAYYNLHNNLTGKPGDDHYLDSADYYYRKANSEDTTNSVFLNNMGTIYFQRAGPLAKIDYYDSAYKYFRKAYSKDTTLIDYMNNLGAITGTLAGIYPSDSARLRREAIGWFTRGYNSDNESEGAILSCRSIAKTYGLMRNSKDSLFWESKAADIRKYRMDRLQNGGF
jgi:protein O-mannosyl-transferase